MHNAGGLLGHFRTQAALKAERVKRMLFGRFKRGQGHRAPVTVISMTLSGMSKRLCQRIGTAMKTESVQKCKRLGF